MAIRSLYLQVQVLRTITEDTRLIDKLQLVLLTELDDFLLGRCHEIYLLDGMSHLMAHAL